MANFESMFWTNGTGDGGSYSQDSILKDWMRAVAGITSLAAQGVYPNRGNMLAVTSTGNNSITVDTGECNVDGSYGIHRVSETQSLTAWGDPVGVPVSGTTGKLVVLRKSWAAETVRPAIISSADGTATIPTPTQTSLTTWEVPLASFTCTTGGVIGALTDLRSFLPLPNQGAGAPAAGGGFTAVASASTLTLPSSGSYFQVSGTTTITAISARPRGDIVTLEFQGAAQLTYNATSMILKGALSTKTVAGDVKQFISEGAGNWREITSTQAQYLAGSAANSATASGTLTPGLWLVTAQLSQLDTAGNHVATMGTAGCTVLGGATTAHYETVTTSDIVEVQFCFVVSVGISGNFNNASASGANGCQYVAVRIA